MQMKSKYFSSIRGKILLSILMITLLTLLSVTMIFYRQSARTIEEHYISSLRQRAEQLISDLDEDIRRAYHINVYASCDGEVKENIRSYLETQEDGYLEELARLLREYKNQSGVISSLYLLIPEVNTVVTSEDYPVFRKEIPKDQIEAVIRTSEETASPALTEDLIYAGETLFSCIETVQEENGSTLGYMLSNTDESKLYYNYIAGWSDEAVSESVLLDSRQRVIAGFGTVHMGDTYGKAEAYQKWFGQKETSGSDGDHIYIYCPAAFTEAGLFTAADKTAVLSDLRWIRRFFLGILSVFLVLAVVLALYLSYLIYRPLKNLTLAIREVSGGNLRKRAQVKSKDEIGELAAEFNKMLDEIENLIERLIEEENKKKDMELEALQYQITPHFMYNTLNSIKFAALLKGDTEIGQVIGDFVELLQAAVSKKGAFLTVTEEIHILKNYVRLQEFRYGGSFEVAYDVEEEAGECLVPRLILQPLAENALLHGMNMKEKAGKLKIGASVNGEQLILKVIDNGRGMSREQIQSVLASEAKKERGFTAVGIPNIRDRLKLYYGDNGGIKYESSENGTTAVIYLPVKRDGERDE